MTQAAPKAGEAEFIQAPNTLRAKVGARFGGVDAEAIARAEAALAGLASQFDGWLKDEAEKLEAAHREVRDHGATTERMNALYTCAHDLKGLGGTYGFPLVSRMAGSLCKLMDGAGGRTAAPLFLIDAHIDGIRALIRDDIRAVDHPVGVALSRALEARVAEYVRTDERGEPIAR